MSEVMWVFLAGVVLGSALGPTVERICDFMGECLLVAVKAVVAHWKGRKS